MRVLYYALGSGAGHIIRSLTVLKAIEAVGELEEATMLVSSSFHNKLTNYSSDKVKMIAISSGSFFDRKKKVLEYLISLLNKKFDYIIVDSFPYGLYLELKDIWKNSLSKKQKWIFIFRRLLKPFEDEIILAFEKNSLPYERVIIPNSREMRSLKIDSLTLEQIEEKVSFNWVGQILAKNQSEESNQSTNSPPVVCHTGKEIENSILIKTLRKNFPDEIEIHDKTNFTFPITPYLKNAPFVCGAAGYNLVNELAYLGIPALIYPFPREFDDQFTRIEIFSSKYPNLISMIEPNWWEKLEKQLANYRNDYSSANRNSDDKDFEGAKKIARILLSKISS
ncbi:MAG: glycosyltransferase [Candidatus Kariarchaeaceae archaeon]